MSEDALVINEVILTDRGSRPIQCVLNSFDDDLILPSFERCLGLAGEASTKGLVHPSNLETCAPWSQRWPHSPGQERWELL